MAEPDPTPPAGKPVDPKPAGKLTDPRPAGKPVGGTAAPNAGSKPASRPPIPPALSVTVSPQAAKACGLAALGLLAVVILLQLVGMLAPRGPDPEVMAEVRTTARAADKAREAVDALDARLKDEPANLPPELVAAVKDAQAKLGEFQKQLTQFQKVMEDTKEAANGAKMAADGAQKAAKDAGTKAAEAAAATGQAKSAAEGATKAAADAGTKADTAAAAAGQAKTAAEGAKVAAEKAKAAADAGAKAAGETKGLVEKQVKVEDLKKAADTAAGLLADSLNPKLVQLAKQGEYTQETNRLLRELIQLTRPDAGRADLAVVLSHGEKVNARRLLPELQRALDQNPARAMFKGFRVSAVVETDGLDLKAVLAPVWPGPGEVQTFDTNLGEKLPDQNGRAGAPGKLDPNKLFAPPAKGVDPAPRQCVFVTHPGYAPPPADAAGWKDVRVDAVLIAPAGDLAKLRDDADRWAAFCRGHRSGLAVVIPDDALPAVGDALRRLAAPGFPAPPPDATAPEPKRMP